jgi:endonuclease YncB( thermonuclease family)
LLHAGEVSADPIDRDQIQVVDADTVRIGGESVRLVGFDAPETTVGEYRCDAELERGQRAAKRLGEILDSGALDIRYRKNRDRYGRLLALLRVNGLNVEKILIGESLAVRYRGSGPKWIGAQDIEAGVRLPPRDPQARGAGSALGASYSPTSDLPGLQWHRAGP